jgi:hypothetical protein
MCKVDYNNNDNNNKLIHTPTYTYNEVMHLLELVGVVEHKWFFI